METAASVVSQTLPAGNAITATTDTGIERIIELMVSHHSGVVVIVDEDSIPGLVSETDIVRIFTEFGGIPRRSVDACLDLYTPMILPASTPNRECLRLMTQHGCNHAVITADIPRVVSVSDLRRALEPEYFLCFRNLNDLISAPPPMVTPDDTLQHGLTLIDHSGANCVLVGDAHNPIGLLSPRSLVRQLYRRHLHPDQPVLVAIEDCIHQAEPGDSVAETSEKMTRLEREHILVRDAGGEVRGIVSERDILTGLYCEDPALLNRMVQNQAENLKYARDNPGRVVDLTPAAIYTLRSTGNPESPFVVNIISDAITTITGYTPREWIDQQGFWVTHIHPDDRQQVLENQEILLASGRLDHEYRFRHRDGTYRWIHDKLVLVNDTEGEPLEVVGSWMDISKRKSIEETLRTSEQYLRTIFMSDTQSVMVIESDGTILDLNPVGLRSLEAAQLEAVKGKSLVDFVETESRPAFSSQIECVFRGESVSRVCQFHGLHGRICWLEIHAIPIFDDKGSVPACLLVGRDITELRRTEDQLRKLSRAVEHSPNAVIVIDADGTIEYANPTYTHISGFSLEEVVGSMASLLMPGNLPPKQFRALRKKMEAGLGWSGEVLNMKKDGTSYWSQESIAPIHDDSGQATHFVIVQQDITESRKVLQQLDYHAKHDLLTGLINRREFEARLVRLLSSKNNTGEHVLCFLDLDRFKVINDTCGHFAGDELLRQLCTILKNATRQRDTVARLGGDEFAILLERCSLERGKIIANQIKTRIEAFRLNWEGHNMSVSVSIGLVRISNGSTEMTELLKQADAACYAAKEGGRNRVHVFHTEDEALLKRSIEMMWVSSIEKALEENRFQLFYQPIAPLQTADHRLHMEILLRMKGENGELIAPGTFLPAAEQYNLSGKIDKWVIRNLFEQLKAHHHQLDAISEIAVNLSSLTLDDDSFPDLVLKLFERSGFPANKICFEITETAAISNLAHAETFMRKLKARGCRFSLDDFGSGWSSFAYLKSLPVDYIKIDGLFVRDIIDDPINSAMVKSINEIGHVMNKKTIAEFAENQQILDRLKGLNVDYGQGYGIRKPEPMEHLWQTLEQVNHR